MKRLLALVLFVLVCAPSLASAQDGDPTLDVLEVSGVIDGLMVDFVESTIAAAADSTSEVVVIQLDSPGTVGVPEDRYQEMLESIRTSPVPVAVWVGPEPAEIRGDAKRILEATPHVFASGNARFVSPSGEVTTAGEGSVPVVPTLQQVFQNLDGETGPEGAAISTLTTNEEGQTTTWSIVFHSPSYWARFWHLATSPNAVFFFVVVGLAVVTFEFYAIGPGLAAATGALSLILGAYGLAVLPIHWWALLIVIAGWALLTMSYQRGGVLLLTTLGAVLMAVGGLNLNAGEPAIASSWILQIGSVLAVLFFFLLAMPVVGRARFSTPTLGAEGMIGRVGRAVGDLDPEGEVEIDGAVWSAGATRAAGIGSGDQVRVVEVDGVHLDVEPVDQND